MRLTSKIAGLLLAVGLAMTTRTAPAQGVINAMDWSGTVYGSPTTNAIGWAFTPTEDIAVTAILASAGQVSFWTAAGTLIASYDYHGPYGTEETPPTEYQGLEGALFLAAGQQYYIFAQNADQSSFFDYIFGSPSGASGGPNSFGSASYLAYQGSYLINDGGQWTPSLPLPNNVNYLLLGPSFQFTVVPEPTTLGWLALGAGILLWHQRRSRY